MKTDYNKLAISLVTPFIAGAIGSVFTFSEITGWYAKLSKPFFNPPNWIFGPVWTTLYILMGVSFYLVWIKKPKKNLFEKTSKIFGIQLALNALWSITFFGLHQIPLALIIIVLLYASIVAMVYYFKKTSKTAAKLQIPYLAWIAFAMLLNASILLLN